MSQPKMVVEFKGNELCYNGLLPCRGKYLYSSRSGQIWKTEMPEDVNFLLGDSGTNILGLWSLSQDKTTLTVKNKAAIMSNKLRGIPTSHSISEVRIDFTKCMMLVLYNNRYYWLYNEIIYEVKWIRSTVTEYLMLKNFSNA